MLNGVRNFIAGWREFSINADDRAMAFDIMYKSGAVFWNEHADGDTVSFKVREAFVRELCSAFELCGIEYAMSEHKGLLRIVKLLSLRPALFIGGVFFLSWMLYSSRLIWDVRVSGNTKTDTAEIIALLDELGCGVGEYYPGIDFASLHAKYAAVQHDIAWLSVYMNGTVAEVQVRELYADTRPKHEDGVYANIVAECDGVVESVNVFEGQVCVKAGDTVREGQVLISGVVENKDGSVRYEYAAGEVFCTVAHPIKAEISTQQEEKVYTGRVFSKKSVKFFKKSINLFGKGGIESGTYDKIDTMEQLCPFGLCTVPIWISKTDYREYSMETVSLSADEAVSLAMVRLNEEIRTATQDAELLSREVDIRAEDGVCTAYCLLYLRRDIAKTAEFNTGGAE